VLLGGQLVGHGVGALLLAFDFPMIDTGIDTAPRRPSVLIWSMLLAAWFNTRIPHTGVEMRPLR
jgi:LPLT family lysophospholipid transporter-like MFS transporter